MNLRRRFDRIPFPLPVGYGVSSVEDAEADSLAIELPMMGAISRLAQKLQLGLVDKIHTEHLRDYSVAYHYYENVRALLLLLLDAKILPRNLRSIISSIISSSPVFPHLKSARHQELRTTLA